MEHSDSKVIEKVLEIIEYFAVAIEVLAVAIIVVGVVWATYSYVSRNRMPQTVTADYERYRVRLGRTLLLGLEILVAADIIRTVALDASLESVAILGLLVLIRTFLSWSLEVEMDNRWPWQPRKAPQGDIDLEAAE